MRTCKLLTGVFAAVLAVSLAGCKYNVVSTETSFEENAHNLSAPENGTLEDGTASSDLSVKYNFTQAGSDTIITVEIPSAFKLDEASVDTGVNFYECEKNSVFKGCPIRKTLLTKTKVEYNEVVVPLSGGKKYVSTTVSYVVDTSAVKANKVAVLFDATVLKTKQGTAFLNGNGNGVAGEETDSCVDYITILYQSDEAKTPTVDVTEFEVLGIKTWTTATEEFAPYIYFDLNSAVKTIDTATKIVFKEYGDILDYSTDLGILSDTTKLEVLNQCYLFQTRAWNVEEWTSTPLTFAIAENLDPDLNGIIASVDYPAAGTEWRVVFISKPGIGNEKNAQYYGGHTPYITYRATEKKYVLGSIEQDDVNVSGSYKEFMSNFYPASPAFIAHFIDYSATAEKTFVPAEILSADVKNFQNDVLNLIDVPKPESKAWRMKPKAELANIAGFLVLDKDGEIVESVADFYVDPADGKTGVKVSILDTTIDIEEKAPKLYVGAGTTLKENKEYPAELAFGCTSKRSLDKNNGYIEVEKYLKPGKPLAPGFVNLKDWLTDVKGDGSAVYDETTNSIAFISGGQAGIVFPNEGVDFSDIEKIVIKPYGTNSWIGSSACIYYGGYDTKGEFRFNVDTTRFITGSEFQYNVSNFLNSLAQLDSLKNITSFGIICYNQDPIDFSIAAIELVAKN